MANSLTIEKTRRRLRRGARDRGRVAQRQRRRDRGAARHQRQRQVDTDEMRDGHRAPARRPHHRRDRRREARSRRPHAPSRSSISASRWCRKAAACSRADRRGKSAARRLPPQGARHAESESRFLLRELPAARRAAPPAGRLHERRRAADARAGARADAGAAHSADRRAVGRPGAGAGQPHHRHDPASSRTSTSSRC